MKSTKYSDNALQLFGKFFRKHKKNELIERNILLEQADIRMEYEEYHAVAILNILIGFILALIISAALIVFINNHFTILLILILPSLTVLILGLYYLYLPRHRIQKRGENIDRYLPYAINFISSMAMAGVSPTEIFQTLSTVKVYGEIQTEAKRIAKEINFMGIDNITALKHAIELSPSKKFKVFLQGMIGTIQSGSNLHDYINNVSDKLLEEDLIERKKNLDLLSVVAETFVIAVIAFPIFLVIILSVMGFFGGSINLSIDILFLFSFFVLPLIYLGFYVLVKSTNPELVSKYITDKKQVLKDLIEYNKRLIRVVLLSLFIIAICALFLAVLIYYGYIESSIYLWIDFLFLAFLLVIGPYGYYKHYLGKIKDEIQERFPEFLVEIGDSLSSGMNTIEAIKVAEKGRYGKLSPEINKMKIQLSWNMSIKDVFINLADRIKSGIIQRIVITINEGLIMGGNTSKIFKAAAKEVSQVNQIEDQRKANMSIYMSVIILCFFVFLAIIIILDRTIFTSFFDIQELQVVKVQRVLVLNVIDPLLLKYALFSFVFVQSIGSGILAGFMMDGRVSSGVRYACILGLVSFFVFKILF